MKLRALRLKAFRSFTGAVQLEDFDDGMNILAGPNEMGKSTIFHALEAAFLLSHRVSGAALDAMRPHGGGEPRVDVDFDAGGQCWRMCKQFGRGKAAALINLTTGQEEARGGEAEERFAALAGLAGEGPARLGLVWVRQQRSLLAPDPDLDPETGKPKKDRSETNALIEAIGREVDAVAGGEAAARVAEKVAAALSNLVTLDRKVPKKNGPLDLANRAREAAQKQLDEARRIADGSEQRMQRIAALGGQLSSLDTPEARAEAEREIKTAEDKIAEAAKTRAERDVAAEALQARRLEAEAARKARDALQIALAEVSILNAEAGSAGARETAIKSRLTELKTEIATASTALTGLQAQSETITQHLAHHDLVERRKGALDRLEALQKADAAVQHLESEITVLADALAADPATPERLKLISEHDVTIAVTDAQLSAVAPFVDIALKPGGQGRIRVAGEALNEDRRTPVAGELNIDIDGIATIRVVAADGARLAETGRRRTEAGRAIAALLGEMGAADLADARVRAAIHARQAEDLAQKRAKLSGIAPQGRATLQQELAHLQHDIGAGPERLGDVPPRSGLDAARAELDAKRRDAELHRAELERTLHEADRTLAGLEAEAGARLTRMTALAQSLPAGDARVEALASLSRAFDDADAVERAARQRQDVLTGAALSDEAFRALSHNLEDRRHQLKRHEAACQALGLDIEKLKSEQSAIDEDGRAGKVLAAGEDAAIAEKEVARLEAEVKALGLLASALSSAGQSARSQYLEPVARGFAPYLARVFPEAGLEFKDTFTLDAIVRAGQREDFATLSDGTREQLAVLVRMGFARLLADRGRAAPLILDDPLVYSDDARLAAMLRALEDAASIHQAVVLTCRETAFATLTGRRLEIKSWQPD